MLVWFCLRLFMLLLYAMVFWRIWYLAGRHRIPILLDSIFLVVITVLYTSAIVDSHHRHRPLYMCLVGLITVLVVIKAAFHLKLLLGNKQAS